MKECEMTLFERRYQREIMKWVQENTALIEKVLGERIEYFRRDNYTEGAYIQTELNHYWFGWSWKIGGKVCFNDWGNGTEGEIYPDGSYKLERYDA